MSLSPTHPLFIAGEARTPNTDLAVRDVYSGDVVTRVPLATPTMIETAIAAAASSADAVARLPSHVRRDILLHCVDQCRARADELAMTVCIEAGKPIGAAEAEVRRLIDTFQIASEEATRIGGEVLPLDIAARTAAYRGMTRRVPIGPCSFITPFNFPLNLVAHKIGPAIAAGCPFVLKPADKTPVSALLLGEILAETDLPRGAFSILPCLVEHADPLVTDERLNLLSFTGSDAVGWMLKSRAGRKRVVMELGGNAACIVDAAVDLDDCVDRIIVGAYAQSGQSCISVQRIIAHASLHDDLRDRLIARVSALVMGDPRDPATVIGPMINHDAAARVAAWIADARSHGATVLAGGGCSGRMHEATLLSDVPRDATLYREEVFGPVAMLSRFERFDDAIDEANDSRYGLQTGVFTPRIDHAMRAWDRLEVGGVVINDVPAFRVDNMPYGGVKHSGLGREGLRAAIDDMTEPRLLVIRDIGGG